MKNIAIFASGSGSNAENLIRYFSAHPQGTVRLVLSNKAEAGAIERAARLGVESMVFDRDTFYNSEQVLARLRQERIDFVVLAGFLWLVPDYLIAAYPCLLYTSSYMELTEAYNQLRKRTSQKQKSKLATNYQNIDPQALMKRKL